MKKTEVLEWLAREKVVPVVRAPSADAAIHVVEALLEGGISTVELTMTVPDAVGVIGRLSKQFGNQVLIGAGTVLSSQDALACIGAGAQFIVSPGFDLDTVKACLSQDVVVAPGALTPTEVLNVAKAGADIVKIFPCDAVGGPSYIKALKAPLPLVLLMPTGGVTLENILDFIRAGAVAVGVGSNLADAKLPAEAIVQRAAAFAARVKGG